MVNSNQPSTQLRISMSSQARSRRPRRSYANFFTQGASNENHGHVDADGDASASDFEPPPPVAMEENSAFEDDIVEKDQDIVMEEDDDDLGSIITNQARPQGQDKDQKHVAETEA
jgi:hypothetical protein